MEIPAILEFYGISKEIKLEVLIAKVYKNKLLITSMKAIQAPVILIIKRIIQLGQAMIKITLLLFIDILFLDRV
jgi:hypothetical protein